MKIAKILGKALLLFALLVAINASAAEVTGDLSAGLGGQTGSIAGTVTGGQTGSIGGTVMGGSTVEGTLTGGTGNSISGTVIDDNGGGGGGSSGSRSSGGGGGGGAVLGASTGNEIPSSGAVLGVTTPGFPATGFGPDNTTTGNLIGSLLIFASLLIYGFYRALEKA